MEKGPDKLQVNEVVLSKKAEEKHKNRRAKEMVAQDAAVAPECPSPNLSQNRVFSNLSSSGVGMLNKISAKKFGSTADVNIKPK